MVIFNRLKNMEVHKSMREISELIYETCKTYLKTQAKFIFVLWAFIATIIVVYFGGLENVPAGKVAVIAGFSVIGIVGSCAGRLLRHPGQHLRQLALRVRRAPRQAVPDATRSRCRPA